MNKNSIAILSACAGLAAGLTLAKFLTGSGEECIGKAKFKDVVVSAGSTDLIFSNASFEEVVLRYHHEGENRHVMDKFIMRGDGEPAGPNTKLLGASFRICRENGAMTITPE